MLDSCNIYFYQIDTSRCNVLTIFLSYTILYLRAVVTSGYREYGTLYYCVYSTIEIALSARSSKYNTYNKYILSLHITPNVSFYYKQLYCNCPELLKNRFEIYSCHSIISSCNIHIVQRNYKSNYIFHKIFSQPL